MIISKSKLYVLRVTRTIVNSVNPDDASRSNRFHFNVPLAAALTHRGQQPSDGLNVGSSKDI